MASLEAAKVWEINAIYRHFVPNGTVLIGTVDFFRT